jgi:precorrin-6B methylase 2
MTFEETMGAINRLLLGTDAAAAIGASLALKLSGQDGDKETEAALDAVAAAAGFPDLDALAPEQQGALLGIIRMYFGQADDLLRDPARQPGWTYTDPFVLDGIGRGSMIIPGLLAATAPELGSVTSLLDVGVGVGWLAIGATNVWPDATVVGLDVWDTALDHARKNIADAGREDRITLRKQDVTTLDEVDTYDCAWVPTFFLTAQGLAEAVPRVVRSVRPGGWIVLARFEPAPDPLAQATTALRTVRGGGHDLDRAQAEALLQAAGCTSVHWLDHKRPLPLAFLLAQKPA